MQDFVHQQYFDANAPLVEPFGCKDDDDRALHTVIR